MNAVIIMCAWNLNPSCRRPVPRLVEQTNTKTQQQIKKLSHYSWRSLNMHTCVHKFNSHSIQITYFYVHKKTKTKTRSTIANITTTSLPMHKQIKNKQIIIHTEKSNIQIIQTITVFISTSMGFFQKLKIPSPSKELHGVCIKKKPTITGIYIYIYI